MLSKKVRTLLATLGRSQSGEMKQPPPKLTVIFMVAIAIRKFQKFESNKYKKSLTYHFDKQAALNELKGLYAADNKFFVKEFVKLAYFTRKFNLSFDDLDSLGENAQVAQKIFEHLEYGLNSKPAVDQRMLHFLCLTLKYLTRNSVKETNLSEVSFTARLIGICNNDLIKNELVSLLVCGFEKLNSINHNPELEKIILNLPEIDQDAKAFLLSKLESNKAIEKRKTDERVRPSMEIRKVKKNQQVVSKTIQTVKSKQETKQSEEADFTFLNLSDCMKNRNKIRNTVAEPLEQIEDQSGSDQSMFRTTWSEALNLADLVLSKNQVLKNDDKDEYLPKRFLGTHYFVDRHLDSGKIYSFFINRMFVSIFCKISRKQKLNDDAVDKLLKCITDFDNLVSILNLKRDFVTFFVDTILKNYWDFKKITKPDIVYNFLKDIMEKTTEEYLSRGWIYNSTEVRAKTYTRSEVEERIASEIDRVRLEAITAFYNAAVRDKKMVLTEERLEIISEYAGKQNEDNRGNSKFKEYIFKLIELAETLNDFNYAEWFQRYLDLLNPNSTDNIDLMLRFMLNQARDLKRSQELFNDSVMEKLITFMGPESRFSAKQKLDIMETINTCLQHENTNALNEENLKKLLNHTLKSNDTNLMKAGMTSLLLSTEKTRSLSQDILKKIFTHFDQQVHDEECTSYIVFVLSRVFCADSAPQKYFLENPCFIKSISSKFFCNHIVNLDDEDGEVKFSQPSEKNSYSSSNQISFLSAKIISRSVENKVILNSVTIDNLLLFLQGDEENDKQTKILASKCLYSLTKYMSLESDVLNQLLDLINSSIYDVSVYLQAAYLRECVKVAQTSKSLDSIHLENISALFVTESLKLNEHDYEEEINKNFFKTLLYEARKQEFNDKNVFLLFENILNFNGKYAPQVLNILVAYSYNYIIPETTVRTLENLLSISGYFEKSLLVLQNVILSGQVSVTDKTLTVFVDYLCLSSNTRLRFYSFKLLQQASQNQELPQDIFFKFELARAGYALECHPGDKQTVIDFIKALTDKGMQLPVDTKLALEKEIRNTAVLKIFANVSRNKQIIEQNLLSDLIKLFDPTTAANKDIILIKIFENAAKNNQALPPDLLEKLETALSKKDLERSVLPVFIYLAQKGENLSPEVNNKLLDWLSTEQDPVLRQELLSSLGSLIDANKRAIKLYLSKLNRILTREIMSDNFNIQKLCITTIHKLVSVSKQIDNDLLEKLVQIGTHFNCNEFIRNEIEKFFDSVEDNYNPLINQNRYREKIKLANLQCKSPKAILAQLNAYANLDGGFLPQNYKQLKDLIDNGSTGLQEEVLSMLLSYKYKNKITDELLESVAILFESTLSESIKNSCLQLFNATVKDGKTLDGRAGEIWEAKLNRDENLKKFFQNPLAREIKQEFQLSDQVVLDLLQLVEVTKKVSIVQTLADLIQLIIKEKSNYIESKSFLLLIEKCLIKNKILEITLPCYCRLIKERKVGDVKACLEATVLHFCKKESDVVDLQQPRLFECMYFANKFTELPDICMKLVASNLNNSNEIIRKYSFAILRTSKEKYKNYENILSDWCDIMLERVAKNANVKIEKSKDLDLLEILVSVKFFDATVFKKEKKMWKRELLVSSIFESFKVLQIDQIHFYVGWFTVEKKFQYHKSCKILSLIQNSEFDSFSQIIKLVSMIPELEFDDVIQKLTIYGPEPYEAFKQDWCMKKIQTCSSNNFNNKYCSKLAEKLCTIFDIGFIDKLFGCLKTIDNLSTFENLIDLCSREKIDMEEIMGLENIQLNDLKLLIEANLLCKRSKSKPESEIEKKNFLEIYENLIKAGWTFAQLSELITTFNCERFQNLLHLLNTIQIYHLSSSANFDKCKQIFAESKYFQVMIRELNKLAIENHFQLEGKVKDLNELLAELEKTNQSEKALVDFIQKGSLNIKELIFTEEEAKLSWNEKQIYLWAKDVKSNGIKFSDYEAIAIILRANYIVTGHTLTDIQILCSLIALRSGGGALKSKLLQVATGEGKSTIICILAIINALRGKQVDVITSSPVLAERDAKQKAKLYRMFDLTCSDNNDKTVYLKGKKDCYSSDIVYGEMSQFQFDILRDNYSKLGTLGGRTFTTAIVDEVDSMLIDDSSKIARLSSTVPGMDHFQAVYVFIWQRLISIKEKFIGFKNKMYFVNGQVGFENGKVTLEIADNNNDIVKIPDLEAYLLNAKDISPVGEVVDDIDEYLRKNLESYLDAQIKENRIYIPNNFNEFLKKQKPKWIANAVEAFNYQENVHYIVQGGEIKPVDYYSTGIVQSATNWSDGLHQFLQLKHNLKMTSETLTTNFLSNIGFMKKYEQVYGLTGTLGSETARKVLKDVYKVELINIPQRRQKQYLELEAIVAQGEANWLKEITSSIKLEIQKERGILVICETIEHANRISGILKSKLRSSAVKLYTMNDMNQEKNVEKILPGEVIIATNLAGRGTDIQTDEIEATGGLHVILTFMPSNQRVEDQAFGRTARQGKRGTGLMILNGNNLVGNATTTKNIKVERDGIESKQLEEFKEKELKLIQVKDSLFNTFCSFLNDELRIKIRKENNNSVQQAKSWMNKNLSISSAVFDWLTDVSPTTYEICVLAAVEEQWAGFLSKLDEEIIKCEDAEKECKDLIKTLRKDFESKSLIKNPYYNISIANDMLVNDKSKAEQALEYFKKAIKLEKERETKKKDQKSEKDEFGEQIEDDGEEGKFNEKESKKDSESEDLHLAGAAHLGVAWCTILLQKEDEGYKNKALASFKTALKCLSNEMSLINATQILLEQKQPGFINSDLYKQLNVKTTILGSYLSGVSACIDAIKRSKRLIDVVAVKKHKKEGVLETIKHFNELERDEKETSAFKNEDLKLNGDESYSLTFNHLTTREDCGTIDQALITMQNSFDQELLNKAKNENSKIKSVFGSGLSLIDKSYSDFRINMKQVDLARIHSSLFNQDKEFKDLTRESAIEKLKGEESFMNKLGFTSSFDTNLTITSNDDTKLNKTYENKQIKELIKVVENQKLGDKALRFDILIKKANENEINKLFKSDGNIVRSIKLNVDFNNLNQEIATAKLSSIKAASFDVEFVLDKSNLLTLIAANGSVNSCKLYDSEKQLFEKVDRKELLNRINQLKTNTSPCFVKFEQITLDQAKKIVKQCHENVVFAISFIDIYDFYNSELKDGQVNFSFDKLNHDTAKLIINVLRTEHFEFSLKFRNLTDKQVRFVLKQADLTQEHMEIKKIKNISELFMKTSLPNYELNEFSSKGIEHIIEINEKLFVPWRSVVAVAALGIGQVIAGGLLIATGFGASLGMGFVTEGLSDIFTAYRAYSTRQFHWSDYCKQKAISLALTATTMGFSKLKNAGKGIKTLTSGAGKGALEKAGSQLISQGSVVGQTLIQTGNNLNSLAWKFISVKAGEAVARECLNNGIKYLSDMSFELLKPSISESVQSRVRSSFCNTELMGYLRKMQAIDLAAKSNQLQSRIDQIVAQTVNPQNDFMRRQWDSVGLPLLKGVLSDSSMYGSTASMAFRIIGTLNGLYQVQTLTDNVASTLVAKLRLVDRNTMTISLVFHKNLMVGKNNAKVIANKLKKLDIFDEFDNFKVTQSDLDNDCKELKDRIDQFSDKWNKDSTAVLEEFDYKNDSLKKDVLKCIDFVRRFYEKFVDLDLDSFSMIMKSVSDQISDQLIRIMDSQLLQPWSTLAVSSATASISERIQHYCLVDEKQNSESQKADQKKYEELSQKDDLTPEETAFMANYGRFRTFAEQINYNSKDYCIAYSQCEMAYYSTKEGSDSNSSQDVKQIANDVKEGGPANLAVMLSTGKMNGVNLKIVDDKNYVKTQEDIDNGVEVIYFEGGANNEIGHAYYMDSNGKFVEAKGTGNDCFFAAFSSILESRGVSKSVDDLRKDTAKQMVSNSENFAKVLSAEKWIKDNHPDRSNNLLFTAGLYYDENGRLKVEDEDLDDLKKSITKGKGKRGAPFDDQFKEAVPSKSQDEDETKTAEIEEVKQAYHHIIPNNQIEDVLLNCIKNESDDKFKEKLENYLNKEEIKEVIDKRFHIVTRENAPGRGSSNRIDDENVKEVKSDEHGILIHASLSNNPNNLVRGPQKRGDDPKQKIDKPLLKQQSEDFKTVVENFENLKTHDEPNNDQKSEMYLKKFDLLEELPQAKEQDWEKKGNTYYVKKDPLKDGKGRDRSRSRDKSDK